MTDLEAAVQLLGGETNKVIYDDVGLPSVMVYFPKKAINEVYTGLTATSVCPAFLVDSNEIAGFYVSKYQNIVINNRAYSLPLQSPKANLTYDEAISFSTMKGKGWHLYTNAERAYVAELACTSGNTIRGNTYYGADFVNKYETGIKARNIDGLVLTGSGPKAWAHNNNSGGVWDLVGNLAEFVTGVRLLKHEIQVIADNNAADNNISLTENSLLWKCISSSGLAEQGEDSLKYDYKNEKIVITKEKTGKFENYNTVEYADIETEINNNLLYLLGLAPLSGVKYTGRIGISNKETELIATAGGAFNSGAKVGINSISYNTQRTNRGNNIGFRACYVDL